MKVSNEGIFTTCPQCDGKMELYRYYGEEYDEMESRGDAPDDYWSCEDCGYSVDKHLLRSPDTLSDSEYARILEIARSISQVAERGDLKQRYSDREDFIEVSVWTLEEVLKKAFLAGKESVRGCE